MTVFPQDMIVAGDRVRPQFRAVLTRHAGGFLYAYTITNGPDAEQAFYRLLLIPPHTTSVSDLHAPEEWYIGVNHDDGFVINCVASSKNIDPGESLGGLSFASVSLPGLMTYYAEGEHPLPSFPEGMAPDSIPGYDDLTPYGPGIVGTTVGPVLPPEPFIAASFIDTLASYKHQAFELGWIKNTGIITSLDQKLANARRSVVRRNITAAPNILRSFIHEVEAQKGKALTSEAYALLKFNAEYLISRLQASQ